jgi:hypothetical protein
MRDFEELLGEALYAASLQNAVRDARVNECAFIPVGQVAGVSHNAGTGADSTEPAIGLGARRPGASEVREDNVRLELMGELGTEHDIRGLAYHAYTGNQSQSFGQERRYAGVLVND